MKYLKIFELFGKSIDNNWRSAGSDSREKLETEIGDILAEITDIGYRYNISFVGNESKSCYIWIKTPRSRLGKSDKDLVESVNRIKDYFEIEGMFVDRTFRLNDSQFYIYFDKKTDNKQ